MTIPNINDNEHAVLDLLRFQGSLSVNQLCDYIGVTATAIRQRLGRLDAGGLIERVAERSERGRPTYQYRLTSTGFQAVGENMADLAEALWLEVLEISDVAVRKSVLEGVLSRLTEKYRDQVSGRTITERLQSIAAIFRQRKIPFVVETKSDRSELRVVGCPYPRLNEHSNEICQLEQQLVARLLDAPVALNHCQCNSSGGLCCTFTADSREQLNSYPGTPLAIPLSKNATQELQKANTQPET